MGSRAAGGAEVGSAPVGDRTPGDGKLTRGREPGPLGSGIGGMGRAGGTLGGRARLFGDRAGDESGAVPIEGKGGGTG